uniref:Trigger_N domain-containing protein n=1 Tax=Rhabditophanes sp. KR3021 TaxID=114890 RepID=A0AC35UAD3_9BILA
MPEGDDQELAKFEIRLELNKIEELPTRADIRRIKPEFDEMCEKKQIGFWMNRVLLHEKTKNLSVDQLLNLLIDQTADEKENIDFYIIKIIGGDIQVNTVDRSKMPEGDDQELAKFEIRLELNKIEELPTRADIRRIKPEFDEMCEKKQIGFFCMKKQRTLALISY